VSSPIVSASRNDDANDDFTNTHSNGTRHHEWLSANFIDNVDRRNSGRHVNYSNDSGSQERDCAARKTEGLEDDGCVVNDYSTSAYERMGSGVDGD
jgi:hypothetical protein